MMATLYGEANEAPEMDEASDLASVRKFTRPPAAGYKLAIPEGFGTDDLEDGYCAYPGLDLDDPFGAFVNPNHGLVGGARTVDDFTPDGLGWENPVSGEKMSSPKKSNTGQRYP